MLRLRFDWNIIDSTAKVAFKLVRVADTRESGENRILISL